MSIKNVLKKASELFVEFDEKKPDLTSLTMSSTAPTPPTPGASQKPTSGQTPASVPTVTVKEIVERTSGPNLDEIALTEDQAQSSLAPGGVPDFAKVYANAKLPNTGFGAEQAMEVIGSLPADLPLQVKRATVQATLSAMGKAMNQSASVNTESVVADASRKMAALSAFEDQLNMQSKKHIATMQAEIQAYEQKIAALNTEIAKTQDALSKALSLCAEENDKLDDVLEFFTLDIGASKNAPPTT